MLFSHGLVFNLDQSLFGLSKKFCITTGSVHAVGRISSRFCGWVRVLVPKMGLQPCYRIWLFPAPYTPLLVIHARVTLIGSKMFILHCISIPPTKWPPILVVCQHSLFSGSFFPIGFCLFPSLPSHSPLTKPILFLFFHEDPCIPPRTLLFL